MKKFLYTALLLLCISVAGYAQITFTLVTAPCSNNGVIQATAAGLTGTITYTFYVAGTSVTNTTGILNSYAGGPLYVYASNGGQGVYGSYAGAPPFNYSVATTPAVCPALGTAAVSITGGTGPFNIQWMASNSSTVIATGPTVSLPGGGYDVLITDAAGCTYGSYARNDSIHIPYSSPISLTMSNTVANCTNGTASVVASGGVGPYSYAWNNAANTASITGLVSGNYNVLVTDAQGCHTTGYTSVSQAINIPVNTTVTNATCLVNNGSAIAFAAGGTPPYTYLWSNAQTTQTATSLTGPAYYHVTATDVNGCTGQAYAYVNASTPITVTYSATASSCTSATGTATVSATGGTAPYTITWSTFPAQTGATATALAPGNYNFTVTDATGCLRTGTVHVPPVSIINASISATNASCTASNGAASVLVTSGAAPYTYSWSSGGTTSSISGVPAGSYSVVITDNLGCSITKSAYINAASPINLGFSVTPATCVYSANGSIIATPTGGTAPYTYSWSGGQTTATASSLAPGGYYVSVADAAGCTAWGYSTVSYNTSNNSCYCTITGTVYNDLNGNCTKDAGEPGIPNIMIHCNGFGYAFTNSAGVYTFNVPSGTYTLSESVQAYYPLAACQNNAIAYTAVASSGCTTTINFANTINPIHDVKVQTFHFAGPPVPGNNYYQTVVFGNDGTVNETAVLAGYQHDGQLGTPIVVPSALTASGTNHYNNSSVFTTLNIAAAQAYNMVYSVPTNIPLSTSLQFNDSIVYAAPMTNWLNDYTPWNNVNSYSDVVVGSYDPNSKEVSPKGTGPQGLISRNDSTLTYTIHFQNTGTYMAQKVVLIDTLSANLAIETLRPGYSNHAYKALMSDNGIIKFTFDNINLPDSTSDPLASIGYVTYTVRLKPNLPVGTQVQNSASIYFDYNDPVKTNTTINTIQNNLSVPGTQHQLGKMMMSLYPNPASNQVTIMIQSETDNNEADLRFSNLLGQVSLKQHVTLHKGTNLFNANVSNLATGLYFVDLSDGAHTATSKVSIMH